MIDATDHKVRHSWTYLLQSNLYTIHRSARAGNHSQTRLVGNVVQTYRNIGRYGTARTRTGTVGRHEDNIAKTSHQSGQFAYALSRKPVIVCHQDKFLLFHILYVPTLQN